MNKEIEYRGFKIRVRQSMPIMGKPGLYRAEVDIKQNPKKGCLTESDAILMVKKKNDKQLDHKPAMKKSFWKLTHNLRPMGAL